MNKEIKIPKLNGDYRRSYVLWKEFVAPLIAIEFVSGNGEEERDKTPPSATEKAGKFWVYERIIRAPYYAIYEVNSGNLEVYHLVDFSYHKMQPNERGHYPILPLGVELGLWQGSYLNNPDQVWLRWWDNQGNLLLVGKEEAQLERLRTEQQQQRAEQAESKAAKLAAKLRELGINPEDHL